VGQGKWAKKRPKQREAKEKGERDKYRGTQRVRSATVEL